MIGKPSGRVAWSLLEYGTELDSYVVDLDPDMLEGTPEARRGQGTGPEDKRVVSGIEGKQGVKLGVMRYVLVISMRRSSWASSSPGWSSTFDGPAMIPATGSPPREPPGGLPREPAPDELPPQTPPQEAPPEHDPPPDSPPQEFPPDSLPGEEAKGPMMQSDPRRGRPIVHEKVRAKDTGRGGA